MNNPPSVQQNKLFKENETREIMEDSYGRVHNYLRISLTERCNLRCFYCMPEEGNFLSEKPTILNHKEVIQIVEEFVLLGVMKVRLTGGEPLIKKNFDKIIMGLSHLPIQLALTTNGILLDKYLQLFLDHDLRNINVSLDSLDRSKFLHITKRDYYDRVLNNIDLFLNNGFRIKINVVLIKGENDKEVIDFIEFTKSKNIMIRFIEFMPFDGNKWDSSRVVTYNEFMGIVKKQYAVEQLVKLEDHINDTDKKYKVSGYKGSFGIISTVSNPFCQGCNRIRVTANGKIKNCLFSSNETDILLPLRRGESLTPYITSAIKEKKKSRGGMSSQEDFFDMERNSLNRSMINIGG